MGCAFFLGDRDHGWIECRHDTALLDRRFRAFFVRFRLGRSDRGRSGGDHRHSLGCLHRRNFLCCCDHGHGRFWFFRQDRGGGRFCDHRRRSRSFHNTVFRFLRKVHRAFDSRGQCSNLVGCTCTWGGHFRFVGATLDVGALFAHFYTHRFCLALCTRGTNFADRLAFQRDPLRPSHSSHLTVTAAQVTEEQHLLLLSDGLIGCLFQKTRLSELHQKALNRNTNHLGKLSYGYFCHLLLPASGFLLLGEQGCAGEHNQTRRSFLVHVFDVR